MVSTSIVLFELQIYKKIVTEHIVRLASGRRLGEVELKRWLNDRLGSSRCITRGLDSGGEKLRDGQ